MNRSIERVRKAFKHEYQSNVVRGEIWLGKLPLKEACIEDNLEGHVRIRKQLGMDLLFLPVSAPDFFSSALEYRRFSMDEIDEAVRKSGLFVGVVVDGPFQRLVEKEGLLTFLAGRQENERLITKKIVNEAEKVEGIISQCLKLNVGAVVVADDLAYQKSTYMNPAFTSRLLGPVYSELVSMIRAGGAYALFHSCGNIAALLPQLIACGFDGLAACEKQCLDLIHLRPAYRKQLTIIAGIDAVLLEAKSLTVNQKREFGIRVVSLAKEGGLILGSSCGLCFPNSVKRLQELYDIVDRLKI
jgi:uroporphyrinogen decarboxylase